MDSDNKGLGQHSAALTGKRVSVGLAAADQLSDLEAFEACSGPLVWQQVTWTAKVLEARVVPEVGEAAGVEACVTLNLLAKARVLRTFFKDHSPIGIELAVEIGL